MKFTVVKTPKQLDLNDGSHLKRDDVIAELNLEFKLNDCWTEQCSSLLKCSLKNLFLFDRVEYNLQRAFGNDKFKILLNPLMIVCYHPSCICKEKPVVKLRHLFDIKYYVQHLMKHDDAVGKSMRLRFSAVADNPFITSIQLDEISQSPYSLKPSTVIADPAVPYLEKYGISRQLSTNYICHWKNKFVESGYIQPSFLTFQQDDALIYSALTYPSPVRDWSVWGTLSLYCLKLYSSLSASALSLYRGVTNNRIAGSITGDVKSCISNINHPGPSLTTIQKIFPFLNYESEVFHKTEVLFHLKLLEKSTDSIKISYPGISRFPVTLGIDEQELNQGTFIHNGYLYGLEKKMSAAEIKDIGIGNFARYIAEKNNFIIAIREYRLTDLGGIFCSSVFSSFESECLKSEKCGNHLEYVSALAKTCLYCLQNDVECKFLRLDEKCDGCKENGKHCVSLVVFHVLWDMGSSHKKTSNLHYKIDMLSTPYEMMNSSLFTIGFGGLHLAKGLINPVRNYVISFGGENFGMNILRAYKLHESLLGIKNAVFIGKDRQSDYLAYMTTCPVVQNALKELKTYQVVRVPELQLSYTENARTQKPFLYPTALATNLNGDVFVLDSGSSCIHAVNRSTVAKVITVGSHDLSKYSTTRHPKHPTTSKELKLSNSLHDMIIIDENVLIADEKRGEVVIIQGVSKVNSISSSRIHTLVLVGCVSLSWIESNLVALVRNDDSNRKINVIRFELPKKSNYLLNLKYTVILSVTPTVDIFRLFVVISLKKHFGAVTQSNVINFYSIFQKKLTEVCTDIKSAICPSTNSKQILLKDPESKNMNFYSLQMSGSSIKLGARVEASVSSSENVKLVHHWQNVVFLIRKVDSNVYYLEECGPFTFGYKFCRSVDSFYQSISYKPPHGSRVENLTLRECIEEASPCVNILDSMQKERCTNFPSRKSFLGADGMPFSETVNCLISTVESWRALERRLDFINHDLATSVYSHSVTNECWVEHSFGYITVKGQGHLETQEEYVQSKRRHAVDFQIRMCNAPFVQHVKSKVRDKGYQELDRRSLELSYKELCEIFKVSTKDRPAERIISDEESSILKKAFLLSKSVPRQSNRSKWREASGYQPNMLVEKPCTGKLVKGDLVLHYDIENELKYFVVEDDMILNDLHNQVKVRKVGDDSDCVLHVPIDNLVKDDGMVAVIPSQLYSIDDNHCVIFEDIVLDLIEKLKCSANANLYSDGDWADIMSHDLNLVHANEEQIEDSPVLLNTVDFAISKSSRKRNAPSQSSSAVQKKQHKVQLKVMEECWVFLVSPSIEHLVKEWVGCIFAPPQSKSKMRHQLIFGRLTRRVETTDTDEPYKWEVDCCKPFNILSDSNIVTEVPQTPSGDPGELWMFRVCDIFCVGVKATYKDKGQWEILDIPHIVELFDGARLKDREGLLLNLLEPHY